MHLRQGFVASEPNESTSTIHDGSLEAAQSSVLNHSTVHTARLNGRNRTGLKDSTDDQVSEDVDHQGTGEKESFHVSPDSTIFPDTSSHRPEPLLQYKDDPPWHVLPELTDCAPVSVVNGHPSRSTSSGPDSAEALHRILLKRMISRPQPQLQNLMFYHAHYPHLQSAKSYNFLLSFAIEQDNLAAARDLFREMRKNKVDGDIETRKFWVRYMVKTNRWMKAWKMETSHGPLPLRIWMEFLTWDTPFIPPPPPPMRAPGKMLERQPTNEVKGRLLVQQFPVLVPNELANVPPRAVFVVVRWMMRTGNRELAWQMTTRYFMHLPRELPPTTQRICLDIIHLHLLPRGGTSYTSNSPSDAIPSHPHALKRAAGLATRRDDWTHPTHPDTVSESLFHSTARVPRYFGKESKNPVRK